MQRKLRLTILAIWILAAGATVWPHSAVAANFNYDTQVTYRADDSDRLAVTEKYTVTNHTPRYYLTELTLTTPTSDIKNLSVRYDDGGVIPATSAIKSVAKGDIKYDYQEIHLTFPRTIYGQNKTWSFSVSYSAGGLVEIKGSAHTVYVPSIESRDDGDDYKVTVDVPASYGSPHFNGAKSSGSATSAGHQQYSFEKDELTQNALALAFGDSTIYQLNFNFPLKNDSPLPRTLTVTLPPDLSSQKSYVNKLDPAPANLHLDDDGNVLADYHLAPRSQITVKTDIEGEAKYLDYDLSQSGKKADIPADLVARYTKPSRYWQTDGAVKDAASKLNDDNAPTINNVKAMYQYVIDHLSYNKDKIKFNIRQGSTKALQNPDNAVCLEYADLLVAMLRSQGIPARMPVGYGYSGSLKNSSGVADSLHAWVEAYVPGIGWMELDPTWGEKFDEFGKADLDHFAFAVWGESDQLPDAVMAGNSDLGYQYENATLNYINKVTPVQGPASVNVKRWAVLPFVSLDQITATSQPGVATDNNYVVVGGKQIDLGSLAPSQTTTVNQFTVGKAWLSAASVQFARRDNQQVLVLAASKINSSMLPLVIIGFLLAFGLVWLVVRLRSSKPEEPATKPTSPEKP